VSWYEPPSGQPFANGPVGQWAGWESSFFFENAGRAVVQDIKKRTQGRRIEASNRTETSGVGLLPPSSPP
jgi:hypothetical protein